MQKKTNSSHLLKKQILLKNVKVHNLKGVDLTLNHNELIVFTGVSGSGKSSLAFDTIYVEGQRRYIESLSTYARRYLGNLSKPDADHIQGISPTIAIEQKSVSKNPRSTVGTLTGIYDFLRVLFAKLATPHCPVSGSKVFPRSIGEIIDSIAALPEKTKILILAPYVNSKKGELKEELADLQKKGFMRIRLDGNIVELDELISIDKTLSHDIDLVIDRIVILKEEKTRLLGAVTEGLELGKGMIKVLNADTKEEDLYSQFAYSQESGISYPPLEPHDFSFNHPSGMCEKCEGLGMLQDFHLDLIIEENLSIAKDCCKVASSYQTVRFGNIYRNLAEIYDFSVDTPWKDLSEKAKKIFLYGTRKKWTKMLFVHPTKSTSWTDYIQWKGVLYEAKKRFSEATSSAYRSKMKKLMGETVCSSCQGAKIKPYPAHATFHGKKIQEITAMPIEEAEGFFQKITLKEEQKLIGADLILEIQKRLTFLKNVGLYYLTVDRTSPTLSGGEGQRVRLASQIGSGLVGTTYILDEPSIGLHPRDQSKLIVTLKALRDKGNSIIVVEHDEETILSADTVVDVGPLAGVEGGEITFVGTPEDLLKDPKSLTGKYLSHKLTIPIPKKRRKGSSKKLTIIG
ncbi:MAG: excinuclease ABC subunit A, partial [Simkaniaceae bacterium]|nr:excinuclease ABC subunit A [Simkaniaceae bacterium]